jgi:hypothetical protein
MRVAIWELRKQWDVCRHEVSEHTTRAICNPPRPLGIHELCASARSLSLAPTQRRLREKTRVRITYAT